MRLDVTYKNDVRPLPSYSVEIIRYFYLYANNVALFILSMTYTNGPIIMTYTSNHPFKCFTWIVTTENKLQIHNLSVPRTVTIVPANIREDTLSPLHQTQLGDTSDKGVGPTITIIE